MPYVLKIAGLAGRTADPERTKQDIGRYVRGYDPAAFNGIGYVDLVTDIDNARRFPDMGMAAEYWSQSNGTRLDGQPNRPLTAYTVEILPVLQ